MSSPNEQLAGTPYSIDQDRLSLARFENVQERSKKIQGHALRVQRHIMSQAEEILGPYQVEIRSALVSESNRIENYNWSVDAVRAAAEAHRELLSSGLHRMLTALKSDPKVFQALGLYKAHDLAETWAKEGLRPNSTEVRALHQLIAAGEDHAGRYKTAPNTITGSRHVPVDPIDAQTKIYEMVGWWRVSKNDPILDATVIHAWLTHIHPFDDGNGRLARLLANLTLIQSDYPPLLIKHDSDRGQYYDALAQSDGGGDILPLYDLFAQITRRTVTVMGRPEYVQDIIHRRLLSNHANSHQLWQRAMAQFFDCVERRLSDQYLRSELMGTVDLTSYDLLLNRNPDGNTWFFTVGERRGLSRWLVWFGFNSRSLLNMAPKNEFPSIFVSARDERRDAVHPYRPASDVGEVIDELVVRPLQSRPVLIRHGNYASEHSIDDGARVLADALASGKWTELSS
jgi:Fic family protein